VNQSDSGAPHVRRSQQRGNFLDGIVNLGFLAAFHVFASKGAQLGEGDVGADKGGVWPPWLLDLMSSTHNESRLAACPLSGVPGRVLRSLSTNTQASWKMYRFVWPDWTGLSTSVLARRDLHLTGAAAGTRYVWAYGWCPWVMCR
jgi:hypothetical protein